MDPWNSLQLVGSSLFVVSMIPQLYRTVQLGRANDVSAVFTVVVLLASLVMIPYSTHTEQWYLAGNYAVNLTVWGTVLYYRLRPRTEAASLP